MGDGDSGNHPEKVRVHYWIEYGSTFLEEFVEYDWEEWSLMSRKERDARHESLYQYLVELNVTGGSEVDGPEPGVGVWR